MIYMVDDNISFMNNVAYNYQQIYLYMKMFEI